MAILIKGMEMPKAEFGSMIVAIRPDGMVEDVMGCYVGKAVPVSPHGRLIDADEMFDEFVIEGQRSKRYKLGEKWELNGEEIRSVISRLPTIVPASKEAE